MTEKFNEENFNDIMLIFSHEIIDVLSMFQKKYDCDVHDTASCFTYVFLDIMYYVIKDEKNFREMMHQIIDDFLREGKRK